MLLLVLRKRKSLWMISPLDVFKSTWYDEMQLISTLVSRVLIPRKSIYEISYRASGDSPGADYT